MINKMKLNKLLPAIMIVIILLICYYVLFLSPIIKEINTLKRSVASGNDIRYQEDSVSTGIKSLNENINYMENAISLKRSVLLADLDSNDILALLSDIEKGVLIKKSIMFYTPISKKDFSVFPVRFSFAADYTGLLSLLEKLDNAPIKSTIVSMQISLSDQVVKVMNNMENAEELLYNLSVDMTLNFYFDALTDNIEKDEEEL